MRPVRFSVWSSAAGSPSNRRGISPRTRRLRSKRITLENLEARTLLAAAPQPLSTLFVSSLQAISPINGSTPVNINNPATYVASDPRAYFEQLGASAPRATAPPTAFTVDFSSPLDTTRNYSTAVQLQRSLDGNPANSTTVAGLNVGLDPSNSSRLIVQLPGGTPLQPGYYRLSLPNSGSSLIVDSKGEQLDGEFLANPTALGGFENLLPTGQYRDGLSGDGVPGGAFQTGYVVVPNGNVIFASADFTGTPNGSAAAPYANLGPETDGIDRNQNGFIEPTSAFQAAQAAAVLGPVVIVAQSSAQPFVLAAPAGIDPGTGTPLDGSASAPALTTLVFQAGSALKMQNASLFFQNQGSALQVQGGTGGDRVHFTSFSDDTIGGDTNKDGLNGQGGLPEQGGRDPQGGDWGGIVLRNFNQQGRSATFPIDGRLKNAAGGDAASGAEDSLSIIDFAQLRFAGGTVPRAGGIRYDAMTLFNSRPAITNTNISETGGATSSQAAISADVDSLREDSLARGLLVRRTNVTNNSLNGIWIRPNLNGVAAPTNATSAPFNAAYTLDDPLPYILTSQLITGQTYQVESGSTAGNAIRLYIQPGMILKSQRGAGINGRGGSINIGDRTYIRQYDANNSIAPTTPGFLPSNSGDARVILTSLFDDNATSFYIDPQTGLATTIVPAIDSDNGGPVFQPGPGNVPSQARWGGVTVPAGVRAVIDEVNFLYGGGPLNTEGGTDALRPVLTLTGTGANVVVTNNDFLDNLDAPIRIQPNGLLAADPLRPLQSANPFFRGNVMQRNTYNGMRVQAQEIASGQNNVNLTVNSIWDDTDLTYVMTGTIQLDGHSTFDPPALPNPTNFTTEIQPDIVLTLQSSMANTLLANGDRVPGSGESVLVKLLNAQAVPGSATGGSQDDSAGGAGWIVGVDDGSDPDADRLIDAGWNSQIRILGIGANETTGQQRVPAIITSLRDDSVGKTVRNVDMFQTITGNPTAAAPGDGGLIHFGALSLTDYNPLDPRGGSLIDNADIRYMTRIEVQGGGIIDVYNVTPPVSGAVDDAFDVKDNPRVQKLGVTPLTQNNQAKAMTISNSNLASFSQVGVLAYSGFNAIGRDVGALGGFGNIDNKFLGRTFRTTFPGQPVDLLMYNNTLANMPTGVRMTTTTTTGPFADTDTQQEPFHLTLLNNTFYNYTTGVETNAPAGTGGTTWNSFSSVRWLAMNNIFSTGTTAVVATGQPQGSQAQYNLFYNTGQITVSNTGTILNPNGGYGGNNGAVVGDPRFRNAAAGDFTLLADSAAIDASRSEIGPINWGNILAPTSTQLLNNQGGVRNNTGRLGGLTDFGGGQLQLAPGTTNSFISLNIASNDLVTLAGSGIRTFIDQWVAGLTPALGGAGTGVYQGTGAIGGTWGYVQVEGERDQLGFLRQDEAGRANVGFGSKPFFDIGAFEYRQLFPPKIIGVTGTVSDPIGMGSPSTVNMYNVGGGPQSGAYLANQYLETVRFRFDRRLDSATINTQTLILEAAGGDRVFGNANSVNDRQIDLTNRISYDPAAGQVTVNLAGLTPPLGGSDLYRLTVRGDGTSVIRDPLGVTMDGENTFDASPVGVHLALPSGDDLPGGNFYFFYETDVVSPANILNAPVLQPSSDSNLPDYVTNINTPRFNVSGTEAGVTLILLRAPYSLASGTVSGPFVNVGSIPTGAGGNLAIRDQGPTPADGVYVYAVRQIDTAGNFSALSPLSNPVTIDTVAPAQPPQPQLDPNDDSGTPGDGITNAKRPRFTGTAEPGSTVELINSVGTVLGTTTAAMNGSYVVQPAQDLIQNGTLNLTVRVRAVDLAGNASLPSPSVSLTIIVVDPGNPNPTVSPTLMMVGVDDSGIQGDLITNVRQPRFTNIPGNLLEPGLRIELVNTATNTILGTTTVTGAGTYVVQPASPLVVGEGFQVFNLITRTRDVADNTVDSNALVVTIDTRIPGPGPALSMLRADDTGIAGDAVTVIRRPRLIGTTEPRAIVEIVRVNQPTDTTGTVVGSTIASATGSFTVQLAQDLVNGTILLKARVRDQAGNQGQLGPVLRVQIQTVAYDYDNDGFADPAVYNPATNLWSIAQSTLGSRFLSLGQTGDIVVSGDFNGDGKTDPALFRPGSSQATWLVSPANGGTPNVYPWGLSGDLPVAADYDGDGLTDFGVYRPQQPGLPYGAWYVLPRSGPVRINGLVFGLPTDTPVPADYDGDGKADIAVYRPNSMMNPSWSSWIVALSSGGFLNNDTINGVIWGLPGDIPVPGDYTGPGGRPDGKTDLAVYRPSNNRWYVSTADGTIRDFTGVPWGISGDVPTPGDYDGDGRTNIAIYRPASGDYYIQRNDGGTTIRTLGAPNSVPVQGPLSARIAAARSSTGSVRAAALVPMTTAAATSSTLNFGRTASSLGTASSSPFFKAVTVPISTSPAITTPLNLDSARTNQLRLRRTGFLGQ